MASVIQEETRRLARLVDNLLDLSRLEAGAAEPHRAWTSIEELIRVADRRGRRGPARRSRCRSTATSRSSSVDPVQMERAFVNVLENARRYSGGHPVSVRARAVRSLAGAAGRRAGAAARVERGHCRRGGRPRDRADRRPRVRGSRRPSSSGSSSRSTAPALPGGEHRGSGLGLAIARGFTEANAARCTSSRCPVRGASSSSSSLCERGRLEVEDEEAGSLACRFRAGRRRQAREPRRHQEPAAAPRILVVDDEPQILAP